MSHATPAPDRDRFEFDFEPPAPRPTTPRTRAVAEEFRLGESTARRGKRASIPTSALAPHAVPRRRPRVPIAPPAPGELLLLSGPSGSGKSSLLRVLRDRAVRRGTLVIDLRRIALPHDRPTLDVFEDEPIPDSLRRLARVGLAEVWTWLRPPSQLSEGQRWRLRVAIALQRAERAQASPVEVAQASTAEAPLVSDTDRTMTPPAAFASPDRAGGSTVDFADRSASPLPANAADRAEALVPADVNRGRLGRPVLIVCDEFAAVLDRITAHVVALTLRRAVATGNVAALVATSHDDLDGPLAPTTRARCDFGRITIERSPAPPRVGAAPA